MEYYLVVSTIMMFAGIYGFFTRRNTLAILISVELMLNATDINFAVFNRFLFPGGMEGYFFALFSIAISAAGASEHQTGLVMDVGQKSDKVNLTGGFGATKGGKWVAEHCWEYGFIIRYQKGWEEITGYEYEPWHVRYVGKENARRIHEQEMPLEEYLQIVRNERLLGIVEGTYLGEVEVEESGE